MLAPGFIDLQVNGFGGHDAAEGRDAIAAISDALPATGVTAFLPTLISAPVSVGAEFAAAVAAAEARGARVLGAHIEGPFINPSFRGAHDRACLADPTAGPGRGHRPGQAAAGDARAGAARRARGDRATCDRRASS